MKQKWKDTLIGIAIGLLFGMFGYAVMYGILVFRYSKEEADLIMFGVGDKYAVYKLGLRQLR